MTMRSKAIRPKYKRSVKRYRTFAIGKANDTADESAREGAGVLMGAYVANCDCTGGVLRAAAGLTNFTLADGDTVAVSTNMVQIKEFLLLPVKNSDGEWEKRLYCTTKAGYFYKYLEDDSKFFLSRLFDAEVKTVVALDTDATPYLVFCGGTGIYTYNESQGMKQVFSEACAPVACVADGRVFTAQKPQTLVYSAPFEPSNFTSDMHGGGRVVLPKNSGEIVGLAAINGYVYVFFEYGLARLRVAGSARDFEVETIGYGGGRIFRDSIGVYGDKSGERAFFLAADGLYALREKGVERVCENLTITPRRTAQVCNQAVADGRYYLRFIDKSGTYCGVAVDIASEEGHYIYAKEGLSVIDGVAVCRSNDKVMCYRLGEKLPSGITAEFEVVGATFGVGGMKTLEKMRLLGEGAFVVTVETDKRSKTYYLVGSTARTAWDVRMRGKWFKFHFQMSGVGSALYGMEVEFSVLTGVE